MGNTHWIEVLDPPLDVEAMHARVRALPCVVERTRSCHEYVLAGDRRTERQIRAGETPQIEPPLFGIEGQAVWLALRWSDNAYDQGAQLLHWVLDHHRCQGQDDSGFKLADNDAIRDSLRGWMIQPVLSPEARRRWVSEQLIGRMLRRLEADSFDVTLWFTDGDGDGDDCGLRAPLDHCAIVPADSRTEGLEPGERTIVGLYGMMLGLVAQVRWGDDGALTVVDTLGNSVRFPAEWPDNEEGWRLLDSTDSPLIEAGNGGALRMTRRVVTDS
jgi:hypothetical protein